MYETYSAELCHHGILGQRWGVRRFQNEDGSVTAAGRQRYQTGNRKLDKAINKYEKKAASYKNSSSQNKDNWAGKDFAEGAKLNKQSADRLKKLDPSKMSRKDIKKAIKDEKHFQKINNDPKALAKDYQKRLNEVTKKDANLAMIGYNLALNKNSKAARYAKLGKDFTEKSAIFDKKLNDISKQYDFNRKEIDKIVNEMSNDKRVAYKTNYKYQSLATNKAYKIERDLSTKYGKAGPGRSDSAEGLRGVNRIGYSGYKVKSANSKAAKKQEYTDPRFKKRKDYELWNEQVYYF